ncbi:MAG: DUF86 domain-containing protein [Methanotrichaceae archaeon]|nr:DUF86 domain-containing protein [Methanotrichaceae archaeon]
MIRAKLAEMEESARIVQEHLPLSTEEFRRLGIVKDGIYKRAEYAIETAFDMCAIINSDLMLGVPEGDQGIVENLFEAGILTGEMTAKLRMMRGFRNIIVYQYGKIDHALAFRILTDDLDDLYEFMGEVEKLLDDRSTLS